MCFTRNPSNEEVIDFECPVSCAVSLLIIYKRLFHIFPREPKDTPSTQKGFKSCSFGLYKFCGLGAYWLGNVVNNAYVNYNLAIRLQEYQNEFYDILIDYRFLWFIKFLLDKFPEKYIISPTVYNCYIVM
jgi:hypothetical protein